MPFDTVSSSREVLKQLSESCIKGHRSSGCQHTDRPLFEVKKKGRPVSQCEKCRELRKTKRMHGKCSCPTSSGAGTSTEIKGADLGVGSAPKAKAPRFKPIAPALPNGLKDVFPERHAGAELPAKLNLCRCGGKDATICTCGHERVGPSRPSKSRATDGLATLAQAALLCCGGDFPTTSTSDKVSEAPLMGSPRATPSGNESRKHTRSCCSSAVNSRPSSPKPKRSKPASTSAPSPHAIHTSMSVHQHVPPPHAPPAFPALSSLGSTPSLEEAGCCCGTQCSCPGCLMHRGAEHAAKDYADCTDGECRTCVDHEGGYALPEHLLAYSQGGLASSSSNVAPIPPLLAASSSSASVSAPGRDRRPSVSCIDAFFATAASLPAPPPGRTGALDPTNVLVYPKGVLAGNAGTRSLFGLVELPKLQCNCPGGCGCPEGQCACGDGCTGCGSAHEEVEEEAAASASASVLPPVQERAGTVSATVRSCCSG
ncbi:hypothetical protein C8Q80DRAFT_1134738 [Daedaleopsis nitida]|nr:hypothetical protein C8Q80DRAFT_1134738 [Daedaleopsis nitida]